MSDLESSKPTQDAMAQPEKDSLDSAMQRAPDGGVRAWLVASGGFSILFCGLGFANSFGAFEQYYLSHQLRDRSPDDVAWIGSMAAFLQFAVGAVAGPLFDRFGAWVCVSDKSCSFQAADNVSDASTSSHPLHFLYDDA